MCSAGVDLIIVHLGKTNINGVTLALLPTNKNLEKQINDLKR